MPDKDKGLSSPYLSWYCPGEQFSAQVVHEVFLYLPYVSSYDQYTILMHRASRIETMIYRSGWLNSGEGKRVHHGMQVT